MADQSCSTFEIAPRIIIGRNAPLFLIAGPCVIESADHALRMAETLKAVAERNRVPLIYKSSFDKANRTSIESFRGPGLDEGLRVLERVRNETGLPVLSDVHDARQVDAAAEVLDVIQIPAFLCRQTDLLTAAGRSGKAVNVKKGQFASPADMSQVLAKIRSTGNTRILLTERGTTFGYRDLVVDFRSLVVMRSLGVPVVFDATHSVQRISAEGVRSGGDRRMAPPLARAAVAVGVDGLFLEVHDDPDRAPCDGPNMISPDVLEGLLRTVNRIRAAVGEPALP